MQRHSLQLLSGLVLISSFAACTVEGENPTLDDVAIVGGVPDGQAHPATGQMSLFAAPSGAPRMTCSGTLIHPRVFLTAAHCVVSHQARINAGLQTIDDYGVSFSSGDATNPDTWVGVTAMVPHPNFDHVANGFDVGVLILATRVDDIEPVTLADVGLLDELNLPSGATSGTLLTSVGYGTGMVNSPPTIVFPDGVRRRVTGPYMGKRPQFFLVHQNTSATSEGGTCFGDSGGPVFYEADGVSIQLGAISTGDAKCVATSVNQRVDLAPVHDFLDSVIAGL